MKLIFLFLFAALAPMCLSCTTQSVQPSGPEGEYGLTAFDSLSIPIGKNTELKSGDPFDTGLDYKLLAGLGAAYLGSGFAFHKYMEKQWWQSPSKFYFSNDYWSKLSNFNKFSHFYSVNLLGHLFSGAYEAAGMQALGSTWYSSLSALAYMSYIEMENGLNKGNGFSVSNFSFDILGTAFYIGQYYIPEIKSFMPKVSYRPTGGLKSGKHVLFDDFAGQRYWMGVRVKEFLPERISKYWPSFIMVAAGAGIEENNDSEKYGPMEFFVALDLDAEKLPLYGPFWQFVKNTLNYIHFPMPGLRVTQKSAVFMFCF
ncbi:MAG TPA: DUF2279 domain-containing protein [Ignavibacteriales bacterium]|nr:DUF2279 domain-containing protein [Ignavibacteriales bacterium]